MEIATDAFQREPTILFRIFILCGWKERDNDGMEHFLVSLSNLALSFR